MSSTWSRVLAIGTGAAASGGALYVLLKDDVVKGQWADAFVLIPIMVGIAIAAGHLAAQALKDRKILSASGFALAFVLGTGLVVYTSVGKQAATTDATTNATVAHNDTLKSKQDELQRAKTRLSEANAMADREITDGGCKRKCQDWKLRATEVQARIFQLETEIQSLGPTMPVAAKADRAAQLAALLFGADSKHVKAVLVLVEPFLMTMLFEVTAITAFGYGFGHRRAVPMMPARAEVALPPPVTPNVRVLAPAPQGVATATKEQALADLQRLLASGAVIASQDILVQRWGVRKGTVSKWISEWEADGLLARAADGRCKQIVAA